MVKFRLVDIFKDNPIRYTTISVPNARCVYIDESVGDNDVYEIRGSYLVGPQDSILFHKKNGIFAIYSKTNDGYKEVGLFYPSQNEVEGFPTWMNIDLLMKELTEKINSETYGTI